MGEAAVAAARAAGYRNAGTIEFLVEGGGDECPVLLSRDEHPAPGRASGDGGSGRRRSGPRAIAWSRGRTPALGARGVVTARPCPRMPNLRRGSGAWIPASGGASATLSRARRPWHQSRFGCGRRRRVGVNYDPLLAKLIVHAETRDAARARAVHALKRYPILGTRTNIPFLIRLLELPAFRDGGLHTGMIDEHLTELTAAGWCASGGARCRRRRNRRAGATHRRRRRRARRSRPVVDNTAMGPITSKCQAEASC